MAKSAFPKKKKRTNQPTCRSLSCFCLRPKKYSRPNLSRSRERNHFDGRKIQPCSETQFIDHFRRRISRLRCRDPARHRLRRIYRRYNRRRNINVPSATTSGFDAQPQICDSRNLRETKPAPGVASFPPAGISAGMKRTAYSFRRPLSTGRREDVMTFWTRLDKTLKRLEPSGLFSLHRIVVDHALPAASLSFGRVGDVPEKNNCNTLSCSCCASTGVRQP